MRLTRRGWTVLWIAVIASSMTVAWLTRHWCWYGYCGP